MAKTETEKKQALKDIEAKIKAAAVLVNEAEKLADENGIPFRTGIIRAMKYNEETEDYDLPFTGAEGEDADYEEQYVSEIAGWAPSGLNC
jgi:hypothetical protein